MYDRACGRHAKRRGEAKFFETEIESFRKLLVMKDKSGNESM